jgi:hypothetical protein
MLLDFQIFSRSSDRRLFYLKSISGDQRISGKRISISENQLRNYFFIFFPDTLVLSYSANGYADTLIYACSNYLVIGIKISFRRPEFLNHSAVISIRV